MSKKVSLSEISDADLVEELKTRLENAASGTVTFPSDEEIAEMDTEDLDKTAASINMDVEDLDDEEKKRHLTTVYCIGAEKEVDEKDVRLLCAVLGIKADKKDHEKNCAAVMEYLDSDKANAEKEESTEEEEEAEEADEDEKPKKKKKAADADEEEEEAEETEEEEESTEEEEEAPKKKKKSADEDEEPEEEEESEEAADAASIVAEFEDYPKEKIMLSRLEKHNEAAETKIPVKKLGAKKAYAKLLELMVNDDNEIAEWGQPYIREEEGYCCGLAMEDHKVKGDKTQYGKCLVTDKVYALSDEGEWSEKESEESED